MAEAPGFGAERQTLAKVLILLNMEHARTTHLYPSFIARVQRQIEGRRIAIRHAIGPTFVSAILSERPSVLLAPAGAMKQYGTIADFERMGGLVRDHDDGQPAFCGQLSKHSQHDCLFVKIEFRGGFVEQQDIGVGRERPSDGHQLLLAAQGLPIASHAKAGNACSAKVSFVRSCSAAVALENNPACRARPINMKLALSSTTAGSNRS